MSGIGEDRDTWIRKRYPAGMPVFCDIDVLEEAVLSGRVTGAVGIPYHIIVGGPEVAGMRRHEQPRWDNERRLMRLSNKLAPHGEIIVLTAIGTWKEHFSYW